MQTSIVKYRRPRNKLREANTNDYLGGFGIVQTAAANARIVKWDSAA